MPTLYERIGGQPAVSKLINAFYRKVFTDPVLGPFFVHTSLEKLTQMQEQFFTIALGGPKTDNEISLFKSHQGRGIEQRHMVRFTDHLLGTLKEDGIEESNASDIIARIESFSGEILGNESDNG